MTGEDVKVEIEQAAGVLVGQPLLWFGRAADMAMIHFGVERTYVRNGKPRTVGDWALHIQCPWRIIRDGEILVGYSDMRVPPVGIDPEVFDPDESRTRRDDLTDAFEVHGRQAHLVTMISATTTADLRLELADGCRLEVLPDFASSEADAYEYWRLFQHGPDMPHFVVSAGQTEWQGSGDQPGAG